MKFGSLFAGIGGIDLGLERAGMTCAWQVEIDDYCLKVLEKHWPDVPKYGDVREIESLPYVDLIAGGFPCQPVSVAGARRGTADERWLWPQFERVIRMVRPRYVFVENVPGLLHQGMGEVLGGLASCGYDAEWQSIPAFAVGAPHRRDRVFIVAYAQSKPSDGIHNNTRNSMGRKKIPESGNCSRSQDVAHSKDKSDRGFRFAWNTPRRRVSWWRIEPDVDRMADGIPNRVDRLRALGNAVVPQVAEWIGRRIMDFEAVSVASNDSPEQSETQK